MGSVAFDLDHELEPTDYDLHPIGHPTAIDGARARLTKYVPYPPEPPQRLFLMLRNLEAFFGGAAGGGKSDALLMGALQFVDVPKYAALIIRKTVTDLDLPGALGDRAQDWLRDTDAVWHAQTRTWEFPSSATLTFGYATNFKDVQRYKGAEFQYVAVDESTQHEERVFRFLFSRLRGPSIACASCRGQVQLVPGGSWTHDDPGARCTDPRPSRVALARFAPAPDGLTLLDVPLRMRAASNPGDVGHDWNKLRYVDPETRAHRVFIPSKLDDNPHVNHRQYVRGLREMNPLDAQRMLMGDWQVLEQGTLFKPNAWLDGRIVDRRAGAAASIVRIRAWDLAATEPGDSNPDPDWTVGTLMAWDVASSMVTIEDVVRLRATPGEVVRTIQRTAMIDGAEVVVGIPNDPGQAGTAQFDQYRRDHLQGYQVVEFISSGDKVTRAIPYAGAMENGLVDVVVGEWLAVWITEHTRFPLAVHDDQVDSAAYGFAWLAGEARKRAKRSVVAPVSGRQTSAFRGQ